MVSRRATWPSLKSSIADVDHIAAILGYPALGREGHSFVLLAVLIIMVWGFGLWKWGAVDFALFSTAQFAAHFLVAPPGFPLFEPFTYAVYFLPPLVFAGITVVCLLGAWVRNRSKHPGLGKDR